MPVRAPRLPGVRFETRATPPSDVLPRMDVCAFVGFASSGPLHTPVVVEDATQFAAVFGTDAPLAWDPALGSDTFAYLGPAVRAFFRNGGRRAYVVRVAGGGAVSNAFPVPGLVRLGADGSLTPALARARSEGSWSDPLRVGAGLLVDPVGAVVMSGDTGGIWIVEGGTTATAPGDLLRITPDGSGFGVLFAVKAVTPATASGRTPPPGPVFAAGTPALWFRTGAVDPPPAKPAVAAVFDGASRRDVPLVGWTVAWTPEPLVTLTLGPGAAPGLGSLVRVKPGSKGEEVWLRATAVQGAAAGVEVSGAGLWRLRAAPALTGPTRGEAARLTVEVRTRLGGAASSRLTGLGFLPDHPLYWAALPDDVSLYRTDIRPAATLEAIRLASAVPRFPLAGPAGTETPIYLPLALPAFAEPTAGPLPQTPSSLERDGLAEFDARLFLDQPLSGAGVDALPALVDFVRDQSPQPRPLRGLHAVLGVDEVTIVAVPDAVHTGWSRAADDAPPAPIPSLPLKRPEWWHFLGCDPAPEVPAVARPLRENFLRCDLVLVGPPTLAVDRGEAAGVFTLSWNSAEASPSFVLEESGDPAFVGSLTIYQGNDLGLVVYGRSPGVYYYRVRAVVGAATSDWSNGVVERVGPPTDWRVNPPDASGKPSAVLLDVHRALLRACASRGDVFAVMSLPASARADDALAHASALRAPGATDTPAPPDPVFVPPIGYGEARVLSFGALYHPWFVGADDPRAGTDRTPPDGAVCGLLARRALVRGAWVAPANEALSGVVTLEPVIGPDRRLDVQEGRVNLVRQEPRGFVTLSALTLSPDDDLKHVHIRRLLSLVRRLAMKLGPAYVFEPHDAVLRRTVHRGFESALSILFERGAFAGSTPSTSYRVDVDAGSSAGVDAENGRMVVELRVAPALPLTFLTVRLVQDGDHRRVEEVR